MSMPDHETPASFETNCAWLVKKIAHELGVPERQVRIDEEFGNLGLGSRQAILITGNGAKTFYLYRKVDGKPEQIRLGPYPDLTVEQARRMADEKNGAIARGEDPNEQRDTTSPR